MGDALSPHELCNRILGSVTHAITALMPRLPEGDMESNALLSIRLVGIPSGWPDGRGTLGTSAFACGAGFRTRIQPAAARATRAGDSPPPGALSAPRALSAPSRHATA